MEQLAPRAGPSDRPPSPQLVGVTRRQFFNRSIVAMVGLAASGFGGSMLAFLWPRRGGAFGSRITVTTVDAILERIDAERAPYYVAAGRFYLVARDGTVEARYQKCTHLGCRVPWCPSSQWFECPCHNSMYNRVGEWQRGPAPRGLDVFPVSIDGDGIVSVDTSTIHVGPPHGVDTIGQEPAGPHCVGE